jgi:hypothetical protein
VRCEHNQPESDCVHCLKRKLAIATEALTELVDNPKIEAGYAQPLTCWHGKVAKDALQKITGENTGKELDKNP